MSPSLLLAVLAGCGADPALIAERDQLNEQVDELTKQNKRLEHEADRLHAEVRQLKDKVSRMRTREVRTKLGLTEGQDISARIETSLGTIHCALWPDKAPNTVLNFVELAEGSKTWTDPRTHKATHRPLYDGTLFHRVIPEFMIQGGDPLGTGVGGPGYQFADEVDSTTAFTEPGLLAMANSGPDTNGSQFFITDRATPHHLDGKHTIFGLCDDADVVQRIATTPVGARNRPLKDVVIRTVRIDRAAAR